MYGYSCFLGKIIDGKVIDLSKPEIAIFIEWLSDRFLEVIEGDDVYDPYVSCLKYLEAYNQAKYYSRMLKKTAPNGLHEQRYNDIFKNNIETMQSSIVTIAEFLKKAIASYYQD